MNERLWKKAQDIPETAWTDNERAWLTDAGSLTKRLRCITKGIVEHRVVHERLDVPGKDEYELLGITDNTEAHVREIDWWHLGELWIAARTIIPKETVNGCTHPLRMIGKRSLGDILFADPKIHRSDFEFAQLTKDHAFVQRVQHCLPESVSCVWVRRSLFYVNKQSLLISEIFSPRFFSVNHD